MGAFRNKRHITDETSTTLDQYKHSAISSSIPFYIDYSVKTICFIPSFVSKKLRVFKLPQYSFKYSTINLQDYVFRRYLCQKYSLMLLMFSVMKKITCSLFKTPATQKFYISWTTPPSNNIMSVFECLSHSVKLVLPNNKYVNGGRYAAVKTAALWVRFKWVLIWQ